MATWVLTGSPDNYAATAARGHTLIGMKERRRAMAEQMEPGDRIVRYLTHPWRFESEPELVLDEADWLPAEAVKDSLEWIRKWPPEHWTLAFQGQLRTVSDADAAVLMDAMRSRSEAVTRPPAEAGGIAR